MKNFDYKKICSNLLKGLPQRTTDVVERRFGLKTGERETLEAIGETYDITRERVRQIEEEGFSKIRSKIKDYQEVFEYFNNIFVSFGDIKKEEILLKFLGGEKLQNHIFFLLTNSEGFYRFSEDDNFYPVWAIKKDSVGLAKKIIKLTINTFKRGKTPLNLDKLFEIQKKEISSISNKKINKDIFLSYFEISKQIQKNPEEQFGLIDWIEINPRGVKDKAYLVFKKEEKPLHFAQVASLIEKLPFPSQRKVHIATVHNELIKDQRFVLVGRGLYALKEWGYVPGVVKDIIYKTLKESKRPLTKDEISEKVLKQRFVKENTVFLNLQDRNYFLRDSQGRYTINPAPFRHEEA